MRYLFRFLCVCALGVVPAVGCLEGPWFEGPCQGVVCQTDGNECTYEFCSTGSCVSAPVDHGTGCDIDGLAGVCVGDVCELTTDACTNAEDLAVVCDPGFADEVETCTDPSACCVAECLVEETGVSAGCATCYGESLRCIFDNCAAVCDAALDSERCKEGCGAENGCDTLLVNCTGDLANAC
jgi:hypothetical protein